MTGLCAANESAYRGQTFRSYKPRPAATKQQKEKIPSKTMNKTILFASLAALTGFCTLHAQSTQSPGAAPSPTPAESGQEADGGHPRPPKNPFMEALDKNHDHVIDKDEIKEAAESLLSMDKNGDGELSGDEIHPPRLGSGSDTKGDGSSMNRSEKRRMEREQRREQRQSGNEQQGPSEQGPPPPPPPGH